MSRSMKSLVTALAFCTTIVLAPPTNAQLLGDVFDRATEARDRAREARDAAQETRDNMREGFDNLTAQTREAISEAVADVKQVIAEERMGRDDFLTYQCVPFRNDLLTLLDNMAAATNGVVRITSLPVDLQFQNTKDLVLNLPCRALFPLYRVLVAEHSIENNILSAMSTVMGGVGAGLETLELDQCDAILNHPDEFERATKAVNAAAINLKIIGKILDARGETSLSEGDIGVHGYVHITVKTNHEKKMGSLFIGLSDSLRAVSAYASGKLRYCTMLQDHDDILLRQQAIMDTQALILKNQAAILTAIENSAPPGLRR